MPEDVRSHKNTHTCQKPQAHTSPHTILHFSHDRFSLGLPAQGLDQVDLIARRREVHGVGLQVLIAPNARSQLQLFAPDDAVGMKTLGSPCGAAWGSEPGERWPS